MARQFIYSLVFIFLGLPAFAEERSAAFLEAAKAGNTGALRTFLAEGVDIHASDWAGWPALNWAALMLRNDSIELLLDSGANIEYLAKGG